MKLPSPFVPVVLPALALAGALARWKAQGSGNTYTALAKQFFIPDPDLGWQESPHHPIWLGLDACAVIAAVAVGLIVGGVIIRRLEAKRGARATLLRRASWLVAALPLAAPIAAFASGGVPDRAVDAVPVETMKGIAAGITGLIDAPAGRYEVVDHASAAVTARVTAGHETFNARFAGIKGSLQLDPRDLNRPVAGAVSVDTATVDTGIDLRSQHAREEYLSANKFPRITVEIDRVVAARQSGANVVAFQAHGAVGLLGKSHPVDILGELKKADAAALARLGVTGDVLLVKAELSLTIKETALEAKDFDGDRIPIQVSLVLRHTSG